MKNVLSIIIPFITSAVLAQSPLSLDMCHASATKNHPWTAQHDYYKQVEELNRKSAGNTWYPSITIGGQATWQSDVAKMELGIPANSPITIDPPSPRHDQYKATVEIKQTIYDGGIARGKKLVEAADLEVNTQAVATEIAKVKDVINRLYFAALVNDRLRQQMSNSVETLSKRREVAESGVRNGVSLQSDLDAIDAEILTLQQKIDELEISRKAAMANLALVTGDSTITHTSQLAETSPLWDNHDSIGRPELKLFDLQKKRIDASTRLLCAANRPKVFAFSTLGYGNPGLNMFEEGWHPYAIVGIGVSWLVTDWGKYSRDKQVLTIQKQLVESKRTDFVRNIIMAKKSANAEIEKIRKQLDTDQKLIDLRAKITKTTEAQQQAGTASTLDYITQFNKERDARMAMEVHKVMLQKAVEDAKAISN